MAPLFWQSRHGSTGRDFVRSNSNGKLSSCHPHQGCSLTIYEFNLRVSARDVKELKKYAFGHLFASSFLLKMTFQFQSLPQFCNIKEGLYAVHAFSLHAMHAWKNMSKFNSQLLKLNTFSHEDPHVWLRIHKHIKKWAEQINSLVQQGLLNGYPCQPIWITHHNRFMMSPPALATLASSTSNVPLLPIKYLITMLDVQGFRSCLEKSAMRVVPNHNVSS